MHGFAPQIRPKALKTQKSPHPFREAGLFALDLAYALRRVDRPRGRAAALHSCPVDSLGRLVILGLCKRKAGKRLLRTILSSPLRQIRRGRRGNLSM